jgi:hypothetical protein
MNQLSRKKKIGYKVVRRDEYRYVSVVAAQALEYVPNKPTYHKILHGALAVFDTQENAVNFLHMVGDYGDEIWECEYKPETREFYKSLFYSLVYDDVPRIKIGRYGVSNDQYPYGTRLARWVKIKKEVVKWDIQKLDG